MKVVSWNVNSIKSRIEHVLSWIAENDPDIMMFQELKCEKDAFPLEAFGHLPYNFAISGQKTYNGVAILSKYPIDNIETAFPDNPCPEQARFVEISFKAEIGYCKAISVYVPNGGEIHSDKFVMKLAFLKAFKRYLASINNVDEYIMVGGDYNVAPFDIDVYEPHHLQYSTCFTVEERRLMRAILNDKWVDLYRLMHPNDEEFSWWDYRGRGFEHNKGMRIDMILGNPKFADIAKEFVMDKVMRGMEKASDHIPIMVST